MPRIIIPSFSLSTQKEFRISGEDAHYLINVLRLKRADLFHILDDRGNLHTAEIISIDKKEVIAKIKGTEKVNTESSLKLILVQSILKGEKMELVIQKATELGVKEIYPVISSRTIVRNTEKYERWLRIAKESVRQCGRTKIPAIHEPMPFEEFLNLMGAGSSQDERFKGFIFYEDSKRGLKEILPVEKTTQIYCIMGPEGGFSLDEINEAVSKGFIQAGLGPRILRAETATITALSLLQFLYGDLG
ncbi:MAG: 16S rRNA (uracil(1498)-N(3))-methyltransferase [Thermodesulfovibrionales bacterium]